MIDIIIPFYNRKNLIQKAIQSVKNQTFQDWFLWLIDDGSTDGGIKSLEQELQSKKIKVISLKENKGVSFARNRGLELSQSKWVAFLDSDDEWSDQKLEKQIQYADKNPDKALIHCNETWIKDGLPLSQKKKHKKQGGRIFIPSTKICCISPSAALIKRSLFEELGSFREDFPVCEDYELWLRITSRYEVGFLEEVLVTKYGGHKDQLSKAYPAMDYWRVQALKKFVSDKNLSQKEKIQVKSVLSEKCKILLKGYKKYNNAIHKKEIEDILNGIVF